MQAFWTTYGFYLWLLTTTLAVIALAWLAYNTFSTESDAAPEGTVDPDAFADLTAQVTTLVEAAPLVGASVGRALQFTGLMRYTDPTGAQAFALAVANARGDGFVISSSVRGGFNIKPLAVWGAQMALGPEEHEAVQQALQQKEQLV